jgi:choice-of-anchor B domain-containing protein
MRKKILSLLVLGLFVGATPAAAQSFGAAAGVAGGDVLFSQPFFDREPGSVYVYRASGGSWSQAAKFHASDGFPGDAFGSALAVDGDRVVVGAFWADSGRGAAYVFDRGSDGTWSETARLLPADVSRSDSLGARVALRGDVALVSYGAQPDSGATGKVLVFRRQGAGWREAGRLEIPGVNPGEGFSRAIALGDGFAAVSASNRDSATGAVWVFPASGQGWGEPVLLTGPEKRSSFGLAVAFQGRRLLVGAPGLERGRGAVLVFAESAGRWQEVGRIQTGEVPQPAEPGQQPERLFFGTSITVAGDAAWVGASAADRFTGAVYRVRAEGDEWDVDKVDFGIEGLERGDGMGSAIGVDGGLAAIGLPGDDYSAGSGVVAVVEGDDWDQAARVASQLEPLPAVVGGEVPCSGKASMFSCQQVDLVSFLPVQSIGGGRGVELNSVWGWTDPQSGKEYAVVGRNDGTSFVDVSDPENPVYLGDLPKTEGSPGTTWREIKVIKDHAVIVSDNADEHGMQVFDLTRLRDVRGAPVTFTPDVTYDRIQSAHNVAVNEESGFAYATGASGGDDTCGGGLHMIDMRDPKNPQFAGCFADPSTGRSKTGYSHDVQCVMYRGPDPDYQGREICFGSNETALSIADVTDKQNPVAISVAEYPNVGYTHQTWLTEDQRYMVMDDELDEMFGLVEHTRTLFWDVSDLDDPILIVEYFNPNTIAIDHNQYIVGDKVYQSNYVVGLRVLDISNIREPKEVGYFDTVPYGTDGARFDGTWGNYPFFKSGVVVVTSGDEGLFLLRYRPAGNRPVS